MNVIFVCRRQTSIAVAKKVRAGEAAAARKAKVYSSVLGYGFGQPTKTKGVNKEKDSLTKRLSRFVIGRAIRYFGQATGSISVFANDISPPRKYTRGSGSFLIFPTTDMFAQSMLSNFKVFCEDYHISAWMNHFNFKH